MNADECIEIELLKAQPGRYVLGCDEVGRGPLAGPVTAACVAFSPDCGTDHALFSRLDDSKKLTASQREALVPEIESCAAAWAVVDISSEEIDHLNILQASLLGMRQAAERVAASLQEKGCVGIRRTSGRHSLFDEEGHRADVPDVFVAVDGNKLIPELLYPQRAYVKGDARSWSIAAASIIAKVHRDRLMVILDEEYPGYGFAHNAGYPTKEHREAVMRLGMTPVHRRSFRVR